jgi:preprotein translocase subunit YajC
MTAHAQPLDRRAASTIRRIALALFLVALFALPAGLTVPALAAAPAAAPSGTAHPRPAVAAGTVTAVGTKANSLTITPRHGAAVTVQTNAQTSLTLDGLPVALASIPVGASAVALYNPASHVAASVQAVAPLPLAVVEGTVTAIGSASLTIAPQRGAAVTVTSNAATRVLLNGAPASLSALATGDRAAALFNSSTHLALDVQAETQRAVLLAVQGQVTAVAAGSITIAPAHGSPVTVTVDASTQVSLDGAPSTLAAIKSGDSARAVFDSATKVATVVAVQSPQDKLATVQGQVTAVGASSITIAPAGPAIPVGVTPVVLATTASTVILLDGVPAKLSAIAAGDMAGALYDAVTLTALAIDAQSPHHALAFVSGQVAAASATAITITPAQGAAVTLTAGPSTQVFLDGAAATLGAIAVGDTARALYDSSTDIALAVEAEAPHHALALVDGQVSAVGASSITIAPRQGPPVTLAVNAATQIFLNARSSTLASIATGDVAQALYDSGTLVAVGIEAELPARAH